MDEMHDQLLQKILLPKSSLIKYEGVLKVAKMIESISLDMEGQRMLGVVIEDGVNILEGLESPGQPHL